MSGKKNIVIVLAIVAILALIIEFFRVDFVTKLSKNDNTTLIDYKQIQTAKGPNHESVDKYLIIYDNQEDFLGVKENFEKVLDYVRITHDAVEVGEVNSINNKYATVILIMEDLDKLRIVDELMKYVFEGGNLFVAFRLGPTSNFNSIYRKLGINEFGVFKTATGIRLLNNVLIRGAGIEFKEDNFLVNSSMSLQIAKECEEYAESIDGIKLLWKKSHGQGNIIYYNGSTLGDKLNRGLILGSISLLEEDFIYPIINSKINFIDDFPAPVPAGSDPDITEEFGRTIPRFYKDIWWPNMLEMGPRYDVKYSGVIIGTYSDETQKVEPGSIDLDIKDLNYFGRELISHGGEIGIHGYNHQPLTTQQLVDQDLGYKPWKDISTMVEAINEVTTLAQNGFPNYTFQVYVPPSNILYPEGRKAILAAETDIRIISSLYSKAEKIDFYEQEFEIADDGVIEFPRFTSGYEYSDFSVWMTLNGITMHGLFSHFVHPDDILDSNRTNGKGWTQLLKEFDKFQKLVFDNYSWLRAMTASEGANEMIKYRIMIPRYEKKEEYIKVTAENFIDQSNFILRSQRPIESVENATIKEIDENVYLVQSNNPVFQINFQR